MKLLGLRFALICMLPLGLLVYLSQSDELVADWFHEWRNLWRGDIDDHTDGIEL